MVPCLHQSNVYIKRKLRICRVHKCIPIVSAKTLLTCAGLQTNPSHFSKYKAENGHFAEFLDLLFAIVPSLHQSNYITQRRYGYGESKNVFLSSVQKPHLSVRDCKRTRLISVTIGSRTEILWNFRIYFLP